MCALLHAYILRALLVKVNQACRMYACAYPESAEPEGAADDAQGPHVMYEFFLVFLMFSKFL